MRHSCMGKIDKNRWAAAVRRMRTQAEETKPEAALLASALREVRASTSNVECGCIDPPDEREENDPRGTDYENPGHHDGYCPLRLHAIADAALSGQKWEKIG